MAMHQDEIAIPDEVVRALADAQFPHSPFPGPRPVAIGTPGPGYRLPWLVQTWLPGIIATDADPGGSVASAEDPDPNRPAVPSPARAG